MNQSCQLCFLALHLQQEWCLSCRVFSDFGHSDVALVRPVYGSSPAFSTLFFGSLFFHFGRPLPYKRDLLYYQLFHAASPASLRYLISWVGCICVGLAIPDSAFRKGPKTCFSSMVSGSLSSSCTSSFPWSLPAPWLNWPRISCSDRRSSQNTYEKQTSSTATSSARAHHIAHMAFLR